MNDIDPDTNYVEIEKGVKVKLKPDLDIEIEFKLYFELVEAIKNNDAKLNNKILKNSEKKICKYLGDNFLYWACSTYFKIFKDYQLDRLASSIDSRYYWHAGSLKVDGKKKITLDDAITKDVDRMFKIRSKFVIVTKKMEDQLKKEIFKLIKVKVYTTNKIDFDLINTDLDTFEVFHEDLAKIEILKRIFKIDSKKTFNQVSNKLRRSQAMLKIFIFLVVNRLESEKDATKLYGNYREAFIKYLLNSLSEASKKLDVESKILPHDLIYLFEIDKKRPNQIYSQIKKLHTSNKMNLSPLIRLSTLK